jgi:hypothetical protein
MSLEHVFFLSQIIASIAVVASLIFVGREVRENTRALQRNEHNSTMEQWTVVRQAAVSNRDVAELMSTGLSNERNLDPADKLRLEQLLQEMTWASLHIWDRTNRGIFPKGRFDQTGGLADWRFARSSTPRVAASGGIGPRAWTSIRASSQMSMRFSPRSDVLRT